ncbi:MAG: amidohydrolase family protein, partial [Candidatus Cloacimonadota bacterium]|nr:amidohydrolase family protein [Candidatus Cloacimonadota bacterium]
MMKSFLFYNAKVLTFNADNDITEAILIFGNKIHSVGSYSELKKFSNKNTTYIDLEGKVLLPGFVDTHTHFFSHSKLRESIYLENAKSVAEIESILKKYPISNNNIWIEGFGWDLNRYPDSEKFNVKLLDKYFPDNPVSLSSHDAHTHLCNSVALKRMGISKNTPDPNGGKFGHFS